jgi:hypothetical protein
MKFIPFLSFHLTIMLQQPRSQEETPCTRTQEVSLETLLNKGRKPSQNPFLYSSREIPSPPIILST